MTAMNASEPGIGSAPARPVNGQRSRERGRRATVSGAIRAKYANRIANPSPVARPGVATERRHPEERHVRVDRDREREHARVRGVGVGELERDEAEQRDAPGPAAEPLGVGGQRLAVRPGRSLARPRTRRRSRATG